MAETAINVCTKSQDSPPRIVRPWELSPRKPKRSIAVNNSPCYHTLNLQNHIAYASTLQSSYVANNRFECGDSLTPKSQSQKKKQLNPRAVELMETWYVEHFDHPYPSDETIEHFVRNGDITVTQVKKWMANKRVRSNNTLSFNGNIHPKRLQRLRRECRISSTSMRRPHPYQSLLYRNAWRLRLNCELSTNPFPIFSPLRIHPIENDTIN